MSWTVVVEVGPAAKFRPSVGSTAAFVATKLAVICGPGMLWNVVLSNTSDATGQPERLAVYTALLDDGHLFYAVAVAPQEDSNRYDATFSKVIASLRLQNHR